MTEIYENIVELVCPVCGRVFVPAVMHVYRDEEGRPVCTWGCLCALRAGKGVRGKGIMQYSLDGRFEREWESVDQAAVAYGVDPANIRNCCRKQTKSSCGHVFRYKGCGRASGGK
ncbi:MAG: hypothetical protein IJU52_06565 [Clostridia bacterium]|nr:hypothetical protein [Clostridia bacterium]